MNKIATMTGLALAMGLGGCAMTHGARDRMVRADKTCQDVTIPIYFESNQAELTPEGRRVIAMAAAGTKGCRVDSVKVLGLADSAGDPAANLELSKRRAASVGEALTKAHLPPAEFGLSAAGDAGSLTAKGAMQPVRRRADIVLKLGQLK
ncbi:OmpA family protein [Phenylobacterium sp.]|uniref:OmpA family protein n=1 Tax=Phenylobacterium sp. TaxID=1871053 RepID=UPI0025CE3C72|nr:OmpA family protein [Phenylobacterium sp.]